jgi:hypothetical protein
MSGAMRALAMSALLDSYTEQPRSGAAAFTRADKIISSLKSKLSGLILRWCVSTSPTGPMPFTAIAAFNSPAGEPKP